MKYRPTESDNEPKKKPDLPVFESFDEPVKTDFGSLRDPDSVYGVVSERPMSDLDTLQEAALTSRQRERPKVATDFHSIKDSLGGPPKPFQGRSWTDLLIDGITPIMIFLMVFSVVFFLLDVRFVFTGVHDKNLRVVAFCFVMGCVAINRLVAHDNSDESILYVFVFAGAIGLYTIATTGMYGVGSFAHGFLDRPWVATGFNMTVVGILWWITNRLTHECCVDTNPAAGEIGMIRGAARRVQKQIERSEEPPPPIFVRKNKSTDILFNELEPYDPTEGYKPKPKVIAQTVEKPTSRLSPRHPGITIFYFSVPVFIIFSLGLRVVQHGQGMVFLGQLYLVCFTLAALSLLMLTSLGGLREYFRVRRVYVPSAIGFFWIGLGSIMIAIVLVGAIRIPKPGLPPIAILPEEREAAVWEDDSRFIQASYIADRVESVATSQFMDRLGLVVLVGIGLFVLYFLARGTMLVAGALGKRRDYLPEFLTRFFNWLDGVLSKITTLPSFSGRPRRVRIDRNIALSAKFENPLAEASGGGRQQVRHAIAVTYDAMCALAEDLGVPRKIDQTPYEFIRSFPKELRGLQAEAKELTDLYVRSAYSTYELDPRTEDRLRKFWINYDRIRKKILK